MTLLELMSRTPHSPPNSRDEHYRYFSLKEFLGKDYARVFTGKKGEIEEADEVEFVDGVLTKSPAGIEVSYVNSKSSTTKELDSMVKILAELSPAVVRLHIGSKAPKIVKITHKITKPSTVAIYKVAIEVDAKISIYEKFEPSIDSAILYGYDFQIFSNSSVDFIRNETIESRNFSVGLHHFQIEKDAELNLKSYDFGDGDGLHLYHIDLNKNAHLESGHLLYASSDAHRGNVIYVNHEGADSLSNQRAKYILRDRAVGIFDGRIIVGRDAKYTRAIQSSKALVLSDKAGVKMVAKPQLEIYTDELEASHGSSTGQINEHELFYLLSRGISKVEAKKMLVLAFANELIDEITDINILRDIERAFDRIHFSKRITNDN